jgi:hypothetical protein
MEQGGGGGGNEVVEEASPISSRPPANNLEELMRFSAAADDGGLGGGGGGGGGGSASSSSGNRWPREETLALLRIRSDMDSTFRDATLKAPLWEHVSRSLFLSSLPFSSMVFLDRDPFACVFFFVNFFFFSVRYI